MPGAGDLRDRYRFEPTAVPQVVGGLDRPGGFTQAGAHTCAAQTRYLKGTEPVQAARLQGDQPVVLTIRTCVTARAIDNTWRAVDTRDAGRVLEITSAAPNTDLGFIDILAVQRRGDPNG